MDLKKSLYYAEDIIPFVGLYREIKKPKGKRSVLGTIVFGAYATWVVARVAYVGVGVITKEWNPTHYFNNPKENKEIKIDQREKNTKKNNELEKKTTNYEDILKVIG
jgi:hypothetical protein